MIYKTKGEELNSKFEITYSGLFLKNKSSLNNMEISCLKNLNVYVKSNELYGASVSMEEVPNIIKHLQEAYKEYQEVQKELKNQGRLEESMQVNKANLSA